MHFANDCAGMGLTLRCTFLLLTQKALFSPSVHPTMIGDIQFRTIWMHRRDHQAVVHQRKRSGGQSGVSAREIFMHFANDCAGMGVPLALVHPKTLFSPSVHPTDRRYIQFRTIWMHHEIIRLLCTNANAVEARIGVSAR
jgi:hypothetical protein